MDENSSQLTSNPSVDNTPAPINTIAGHINEPGISKEGINPPKRSAMQWIWPDITDIASAKKAAKLGYQVSLLIAGFTTLVICINILFHINLFGIDLWAFLDVFSFLIIAFGIYKLNRGVAIAGLLLYCFEEVITIRTIPTSSINFTAVFFIICYINSIRGTFAYHKYISKK